MKKVTILNGVVDAVYLCEPPEGVETTDAPDNVFSGWLHDGETFTEPKPPIPSLDERRAAKLAAIVNAADVLLSAGAPVSAGLHVALDGNSRSDLTSMALAANSVRAGGADWAADFPDYAKGWIAVENTRIPLAAASDGWALALSVGSFYAALVQHRRDLKDAALAAGDAAALDAIDISAGWPG